MQQSKSKVLLSLKNIRVFTRFDEIAGLPSSVFVTGVALAVALGIALYWWVTLLVALIYFPPMFYIHKNDYQGLSHWSKMLSQRHDTWRCGYHHARREIWVTSYNDQTKNN